MEKKVFCVVVGYCGPLCSTPGNRKFGHEDRPVVVECTDEELEKKATSIGKKYLADSLVVYEGDWYNRYEQPYRIFWDCM